MELKSIPGQPVPALTKQCSAKRRMLGATNEVTRDKWVTSQQHWEALELSNRLTVQLARAAALTLSYRVTLVTCT